jgi:predicted amidophosphoribosyltransferase
MHRQRIAKRGYNQAVEIARALRNEFALPVRTNLCSKTRATIPQLGLDAAARRRNLHGVFEAAPSAQGLHIAIVDDVMTTGTTARELARVLRAAGAAGVVVWVAARA